MKNLLLLSATFSAAPGVSGDRSLSGIFTPPAPATATGPDGVEKVAELLAAPAASLAQENSVDENARPYIPEDKNNVDFLGAEPEFLVELEEMKQLRNAMMTTKLGDPFYGLHARHVSGGGSEGSHGGKKDLTESEVIEESTTGAPEEPVDHSSEEDSVENSTEYHGKYYEKTRDVARKRLDGTNDLKEKVEQAIDKSRKAANAALKYGKQAGDMLKQNEVNRENLQFFAEDIKKQHAGKVEEIRHVLGGGHAVANPEVAEVATAEGSEAPPNPADLSDAPSRSVDTAGREGSVDTAGREEISFMKPHDDEAAPASTEPPVEKPNQEPTTAPTEEQDEDSS